MSISTESWWKLGISVTLSGILRQARGCRRVAKTLTIIAVFQRSNVDGQDIDLLGLKGIVYKYTMNFVVRRKFLCAYVPFTGKS